MSSMADRKPKRVRRSFTDEFKAGAVRLVLDEGKTVGAVARDLDLTRVGAARLGGAGAGRSDKGKPGVLTTAEREELARLRKENRELRMERDILKKAAAFFAKDHREVRVDRGGEGALPGSKALSVARRDPERLLRVAPAAGVGARARDDRRLKVLVRASFDASHAALR